MYYIIMLLESVKIKILQSDSNLHCNNAVLITSRVIRKKLWFFDSKKYVRYEHLCPVWCWEIPDFFLRQLQLNPQLNSYDVIFKVKKPTWQLFRHILYWKKGLPQCAPTLTDFLYPADWLDSLTTCRKQQYQGTAGPRCGGTEMSHQW